MNTQLKIIYSIVCILFVIGVVSALNSSDTPTSTEAPAPPPVAPVVVSPPVSHQDKYTITKYKNVEAGDNWKYVVIKDKQSTTEIAKELHNKYPETCFKLFSTLSTLKLMHTYDTTNSYVTKTVAYPEKALNRDSLGIINKQAGVWTYTTQNYESVEL